MAQKPLTDAQCREAIDAVRKYGSVDVAANNLNVPRGTLHNRYRQALVRFREADTRATNHQAATAARAEDAAALSRGLPFEREWSVWMSEVGMLKDRYAGPARPKPKIGRLKVVAAGDFHVPFHNRGALARMIHQDGDADLLILGGDFGDAYSASTFTKYQTVDFLEEMAGQTAVMQVLSETFPTVKYLRGSNHPDRYEKRLREQLSKDLVAAIQYMTGGILAPDLALCKRFPNVEVCDWKTPDGEDVSWLMREGDVLVSHAEKYSKVPGAALRAVDEWIDDNKGHLGMDTFRAVVQFHTHAMAILPWRSDRLLVEPGCMCNIHGYQLGSRVAGRPQRLGYVVMELVDGKLDVNSVRLRWLDGVADAA